MKVQPLPPAVTAPNMTSENYFGSFVEANTRAILHRLDGPQGFFARAEAGGKMAGLSPAMAQKIEQIHDVDLAKIGITKREIGLVVASFGRGQERSRLTQFNIPGFITVSNGQIYTPHATLRISHRADTGEAVVPSGRFNRDDGVLWLIPGKLTELFPEPTQRRIAALWGLGHEFSHSIIGDSVSQAFAGLGRPGAPIVLRDGTATDTTTYLRTRFASSFPRIPLTQYSASYRGPHHEMPDPGSLLFAKAIGEEACETAAATIVGFAPTPGRNPAEALARPFEGREAFQRDVTQFLQAGAA